MPCWRTSSDRPAPGLLNGRGRDIVVQLAGRDGGSGHFAVVLDAETDQITGFVPVMLQGG